MTRTLANLIDGEHVCRDILSNVNPSDTDDVVGLYAQASAAEAEQAVEAARAAFPRWSRTAPPVRQEILLRASHEILARRDELGRLLAREEGKTLAEAIGEVVRAAHVIAYMAGEALRLRGERLAGLVEGSDAEATREPLGVLGVISPWNFPIAIPAWKIAPALACGNCVVFKPAELVPGSAWELVDILHRAGLSDGVLNLVMGSGQKSAACSPSTRRSMRSVLRVRSQPAGKSPRRASPRHA